MNVVSGIALSLSGKEISVTNERMMRALGEANHGSAVLQGSLTLVPSKVQRVHTGRKGKDWKVYCAKNHPAKATRHFFQLLHGKPASCHEAYILWLHCVAHKSMLPQGLCHMVTLYFG